MQKQRNALWLFPLLILALLIPAVGCDSGSTGNEDPVVTIPAAPAAPDITEGENSLQVSWDDVEGVDAFEVWYNTSDDTASATQSGGDITLGFRDITGLVNGTTYHVWLKAKNSAGTSGFGTAATGTPAAAEEVPETPSQPILNEGDTEIEVIWGSVLGASSYNVYFGTTDDSASATQFGGDFTGASTTITGLSNGTLYYVWVVAVNSFGDSDYSPSASATPDMDPPEAPGVPVLTAGDTDIEVSWTAVSGADSYEVWYHTADNSTAATQFGSAVTGTTETITGLTNGTEYFVWITAVNDGGTSDFSPSASTTPASAAPTPIFESLTGSGYYISQQTGTATVTSATLGGESCTQFDGYSQDANGSISFEVQYTLAEATDFTDGYVVHYELWIDSTSVDISYGQGSVWSTGYKPAYVNGPSTSPKGQWHTFNETIDSTTVFGYADATFDITNVDMIRIKVVTASDNQNVVIGIRNVSVTAVP
jgi:hypothetical protein